MIERPYFDAECEEPGPVMIPPGDVCAAMVCDCGNRKAPGEAWCNACADELTFMLPTRDASR